MNEFANPQDLATALATKTASVLAGAIQQNGQASLAVSGGSTPKRYFAALSLLGARDGLDWSKVNITLIDERWVGPESERSNAKLVQENLLIENAAQANFIPLFCEGKSVEESIALTSDILRADALPLDVAILGMGNDGHTASFFPAGSHLSSATKTNTPDVLSPMQAAGAGEPRITLTLPPILNAGFLALHIEGAEKRKVLNDALAEGDANELPIRHVLRNTDDLEIYWAA